MEVFFSLAVVMVFTSVENVPFIFFKHMQLTHAVLQLTTIKL